MISGHIQAVGGVQEAIAALRSTVEEMDEGIAKYRLQARLELMEDTADELAENSLKLYDRMILFGFGVATCGR